MERWRRRDRDRPGPGLGRGRVRGRGRGNGTGGCGEGQECQGKAAQKLRAGGPVCGPAGYGPVFGPAGYGDMDRLVSPGRVAETGLSSGPCPPPQTPNPTQLSASQERPPRGLS